MTALTWLEGAAAKYMQLWYNENTLGQPLGLWSDFVLELQGIYGMRNKKAGARKEIEQLFRNKSLAHNNFINYTKKFRTLARLSELEDSYLIEKLKEVLPDNLQLAITVQGGNSLTKWSIFLDQLLAFYKLLNPDKAQEHIFSKDVEKDENAMDVDVAQKKKAKGKQANTASTQKLDMKKPFCTICNRMGHDTKECHKLAVNADKAKA
jgi:hypothetical protein